MSQTTFLQNFHLLSLFILHNVPEGCIRAAATRMTTLLVRITRQDAADSQITPALPPKQGVQWGLHSPPCAPQQHLQREDKVPHLLAWKEVRVTLLGP